MKDCEKLQYIKEQRKVKKFLKKFLGSVRTLREIIKYKKNCVK